MSVPARRRSSARGWGRTMSRAAGSRRCISPITRRCFTTVSRRRAAAILAPLVTSWGRSIRGWSHAHGRAVPIKLRRLAPVVDPMPAVARVPAPVDQVNGATLVVVARVSIDVSGGRVRHHVAARARVATGAHQTRKEQRQRVLVSGSKQRHHLPTEASDMPRRALFAARSTRSGAAILTCTASLRQRCARVRTSGGAQSGRMLEPRCATPNASFARTRHDDPRESALLASSFTAGSHRGKLARSLHNR